MLTSRHRLLRVDRQRGIARIELIHDRLVTVVYQAHDLRLTDERKHELERTQAFAKRYRQSVWVFAATVVLAIAAAIANGFF